MCTLFTTTKESTFKIHLTSRNACVLQVIAEIRHFWLSSGLGVRGWNPLLGKIKDYLQVWLALRLGKVRLD